MKTHFGLGWACCTVEVTALVADFLLYFPPPSKHLVSPSLTVKSERSPWGMHLRHLELSNLPKGAFCGTPSTTCRWWVLLVRMVGSLQSYSSHFCPLNCDCAGWHVAFPIIAIMMHLLVCGHMCTRTCMYVYCSPTPVGLLEDLFWVQQFYVQEYPKVPKECANTGQLICCEGLYIKPFTRTTTKQLQSSNPKFHK